jgi:hypothetical protein
MNKHREKDEAHTMAVKFAHTMAGCGRHGMLRLKVRIHSFEINAYK